MTELDFDELDKAVNSLMKNAPVKKEPGLTDEQTVTIKPTLPDNARPPLNSLNTTMLSADESAPVLPAKTVPESAPSATSSSVASRRGRFMDMVRSSASQPTVPSRPALRQGVTIEPKGPLLTDVKPVTASQIAPASVSSAAEVQPAPAAPEVQPDQQQKTDWPDPLEMADYESTPVSSPAKTTVADEDELAKEITTLQADNEPLVSPFLPDTKVEKRPLGGALSPEVAEEEQEPTDTTITSDQLPANPAEARPGLPEELSTDLMALESDANTIAVPAEEAKSEAVAQAAQSTPKTETLPEEGSEEASPMAQKKETSEKTVEPARQEAVHARPVAPDHTLPPGPISIPQQYREEPSTGDQSSGAIYDTDAYHQPLAHPKKKKSGWMWVIWILLILGLGAAGGAALYFLGVF